MKTDTTGVRLAAALLSVLSTVAACGGDDDGGGGGSGGSGGAKGGSGGATGGSGGASGGSGGSGGSTGGTAGSGGSGGASGGSGGASGGSGGASGGSGGASGGSGGASGGSGGASGGSGGASGGSGGASGGSGGASGGSGGTGGGGVQLTSVATVTGSHMAQDQTNLYVATDGGVKKIVKSSGAVSDLFTLTGSGPDCSMVAVNGSTVVAICAVVSPPPALPIPKMVVLRAPTSGGTPTEAYVAAMGSMSVGGLTTDGFNGSAPGPNAYFHDGNQLMKIPAAAGAATTLGTATSTDLSQGSKYAALDSGAYYVVGNSQILSVPLSGGTVTKVTGLSNNWAGLHADGTNVYFVEQGSWLWKVPKGGGTKVNLTPSGSLFTMCNFGVHPDGTFAYGVADSTVVKHPLGGGAPTTVATGYASSNANSVLLVDTSSVWVLTSLGLFKAPK